MLRQRGASTIAVCMSTGVVQRGGVPILPEAVRVRAALAAGADLVVALPAPYANASAEQFAAAGVHLLAALGCDTLAFGAETPAPPPCRQRLPRCAVRRSRRRCAASWKAACLLPPPCRSRRNIVPRCCGFAANAQQHFGDRILQGHFAAGGSHAVAALPRLGAAHGTARPGQVQGQALASASHIRQLVHTQGIKAASPFVPQAAMELYRQAAEQGQLADPEKSAPQC